MKKLLLFAFLLFLSFIFSNTTVSNAENGENNLNDEMNTILTKKIAEMEKTMYIQNLIQYIEIESEVIIPKYVDTKYVEYMYDVANQLKIPVRTAFRLIYRESCFRDSVTSYRGAHGFMQLMPDTRVTYYKLLRVDTLNLDENQEDIYVGMNLLKDLYNYWRERGNSEKYSWKLSLASYNAGKGTVINYKGIPPYKETTDFIVFILKTHSNPEFYANYMKKYDNTHKDRT